jgi:hypothetical protein
MTLEVVVCFWWDSVFTSSYCEELSIWFLRVIKAIAQSSQPIVRTASHIQYSYISHEYRLVFIAVLRLRHWRTAQVLIRQRLLRPLLPERRSHHLELIPTADLPEPDGTVRQLRRRFLSVAVGTQRTGWPALHASTPSKTKAQSALHSGTGTVRVDEYLFRVYDLFKTYDDPYHCIAPIYGWPSHQRPSLPPLIPFLI